MLGPIATHRVTIATGTLYRVKSAQKILAENLNRLIAHDVELRNSRTVRARAKLGGGTLDGMRQGTKACRIDSLQKVAEAFGLQAYQLLIPDLDPKNPAVAKIPENQREFMHHLERLTHELQQTVAEYNPKSK